MSLQIRRDTDANRVTFTPDMGEFFFSTDTRVLWIGDGATPGGVEMSDISYQNLFNVKLFLAVGDGVTDDTAAIQAAMDAAETAGGGTVYFPPGTYLVTSDGMEIGYGATVVFEGDNAWITGADAADHAFRFDTGGGSLYPTFERVEFRNMWFKEFTVRAVECSVFDSGGRSTITRLVMKDCRFDDLAYAAHFFCKIGSALFEGNTFTNLENSTSDGSSALFIGSKYDVDQTSTGNIIVRDNYIDGVLATASGVSQHCIVIYGYNVIVDNNIIRNNRVSAAATEGAKAISVKAYFVNIHDNILENAGGSNDGHIYVKGLERGGGASGSNGGESYAITINDNIIISNESGIWNTTESGIGVDGGSDGKDNIHIHDNYIEGIRSNAIQVEGSGDHDDISIIDNEIHNVRTDYGIRVVSTGERLAIRGNQITSFGTDGTASNPIAIRVDPIGPLAGCNISNNIISDDGLTAGAGTIFGIYIRPTVGATSGLIVSGNDINLSGTRAQEGITAFAGGSGSIVAGIIERNNVSVAAGQDEYTISSTGVYVDEGDGSPETRVSAPVGKTYSRKDGSPGLALYIKESGGTGNTGWSAVSGVSAEVKSQPWPMPVGDSGLHYIGGTYTGQHWTMGGATTIGTVNVSAAAHIFFVTAAGATNTVVRMIGTTIDDAGNTAAGNITLALTSGSADVYYETTEKWIGLVDITLDSGTAKNTNIGLAKYWDDLNADFTITGFECLWEGNRNGTIGISLHHHKATGWTYTGTVATPPTPLADFATDVGANVLTASGLGSSWKREDLSVAVAGGSEEEGVIIEVVTSANVQLEDGQFTLHYTTD